jgi:putative acetyltransferase
MLDLRIEHADPQGADAMALLREAAIDARALYPDLHAADAPWPTNAPLAAGGVYVVAYCDGRPVACGALRRLDGGAAEVRRMYVHRDCRRAGVGRAVLRFLVDEAARRGYRTLRLETGLRQRPAMRLYESFGFRRIAPFGPYADDPSSVCYELALAAPGASATGEAARLN